MDATSLIVIAIFTLSIISGVTGVKDRPVNYNKSSQSSGLYHQGPKNVSIPGASFKDGAVNGTQSRIYSFIRRYAKKVSQSDAKQISEGILRYSRKYDVNPRLVTALVARESRFNKHAVSSSGAKGLGQLLPSTARGLKIYKPFDIDQNILGTTRYMKYLLTKFKKKQDKQIPFAIAGYLEGPNAVDRQNGYRSSSKRYVEDILKIYQKI